MKSALWCHFNMAIIILCKISFILKFLITLGLTEQFVLLALQKKVNKIDVNDVIMQVAI